MEGQGGFPIVALCFIPFLAFGPTILYALFVWWFDRFEREPLWLIGTAFFWGCVPAVVFALIANSIMGAIFEAVAGRIFGDVLGAIIAAPINEELFKGAFVLLLFLIYRREIDSLYDGFVYGSLVGFGFAAMENVLYFFDAAAAGGLAGMFNVFVLRSIFFGLNHATYTGLTGMGFAAARLSRSAAVKIAAPVMGLGGAMAFHALHNTIPVVVAVTESLLPLQIWFLVSRMGVLLIFGIAVYGLFRERRWIHTYLREEVEAGRLPEPVYRECGSFTARLGSRLQALLRGDLEGFRRRGRLHHVAAELAFRKHQRIALGEVRWEPEIERLRAELQRWAEA